MAKDVEKPVQTHEEELELAEPSLHEEVDDSAIRDKSIRRIHLLWNQRKFLARTAGLGLVAATLTAFLIPKRYQATARLMPPEESSSQGAAMLAAMAGHLGGGLTSLAEGALGMKTTGDLFVGILQSDTIRDDLIHKFGLQKLYHDPYIEDARRDLAKHTDIFEDPKSGIITVTVTDHDPKRSAAMAYEYVSELNWVVNNLSTSSASRERAFLDQRLEQVKSDLESAEHQFSQFASQKQAIDIPAQGKAMVEAAATLQGQLIAAESELQGLRQIYTDNNARVRSLQARVDELRGALEKLGGTSANAKSSAQELYPSLRELPLLGVTYADLLRRTKVQEAVFEALTQEDELAKVEEAKETPSVKVLDAPETPQKKSFPPRLMIALLGPVLALSFGIAWVLSRSAWEAVDSSDPRKVMAQQVWSDLRAGLPWSANNGSQSIGQKSWFWSRSRRDRKRGSSEEKM